MSNFLSRVMDKTYYKFLQDDGQAPYATNFHWPLQKNGKPGKYLPRIKEPLEMCRIGYHLATEDNLIDWIEPHLYICELAKNSEIVVGDNNICTSGRIRLVKKVETWNERTARLFAADCAERALPIFEKERPDDDRPRKAIEAARKFVAGEIDKQELDAARDAARAAARAAARDAGAAAWAAAWAAAAGEAAWAAAGEAARAAAGAAEENAQNDLLLQYIRGERG